MTSDEKVHFPYCWAKPFTSMSNVVFYLIIHWYNNSFGNLTCCHKKLRIWFSSWSRHTTPKWVWEGYMVGIPRNLVSSTQTQCPQSSHAMSCSLDCRGLRIFFPILNHFAVGYWILSQTSQWNLLNLSNHHFASSFNHLNKWLFYFPFSDSKLFIPII